MMNKTVLRGTAAVMCLAFATAASAQETAAPQQPGIDARTLGNPGAAASSPAGTAAEGAGTPSAGLQEIVVTAQRRSENLQRAAIAVSAVSGDALASAGVTKPTELTSLVPSLQIAPGGGPYSLFYLRGVGNFSANSLSDSAIAFNFDGVFIGRPAGTTGFFYDLERVEVVKGPQGTLYGRNATGGAINIITHKADLGKTEGYVNGEYGNYDARRIDAAVNLPLGDAAAVRLSGIYVAHDAYMHDGSDDQDDKGARLSLRLDPASNLKITATADYFSQRGTGGSSTPVATGVSNRYGLRSPQGQAYFATQPNTVLGNYLSPITADIYQRNHSWGVSATIDWTLPFGTVTFIPAHRELALNYATVTPAFLIREHSHERQNSAELRLASNDDHPLRYLLGAYYFDEKTNIPSYIVNQQSNFNQQSYRTGTESEALFGRLTYAVVPQLRLNVGARYTWENKDFSGLLLSATRACVRPSSYFPTYSPGCPDAVPFPFTITTPPAPVFVPGADGTITIPGMIDETGPNARSKSFHKFTYRVGADWDITPRNLLYVSYETSFKSGGFFFDGAAGGVYRPEKISAVTLGSKNRFLDNRLQINLEAFYWRYKDQQVSHLSLDDLGNAIFATENVGRATFKGFEIEAQARPLTNTTLTADLQYLDGKYNNFIYTVPNQNDGVSNGTACPNAGSPGLVYTVNCSGKRPPNAPRWTLNLGAEQVIPIGEGKFVIDARGHYQTRSLTGLQFTPIEYQKAYWQADMQIAYHAPGDRFSIGAFANNIFNKTVVALSQPVTFGLFNVASLRPPRTYGIRADIKF